MKKYKHVVLEIKLDADDECYLSQLIDGPQGLLLVFESLKTRKKIEIQFEQVFIYQCANESYRLNTLSSMDFRSLIQTDEASEYLRWFHSESKGIYKNLELKHYVLVTADDFIDVISSELPVIELKTSE